MAKTLICNATVVDPSQGLHSRLDVLIEDSKIVALERRIPRSQADDVFDADGFFIAPGFVDLRTHLREPGGESSETIESGTEAAAAGGYTTIHAMANTNPICDTMTGVHYIQSRAAAVGCVNVVPVAAVTIGQKGEALANLGVLAEMGVGAFSDSMNPIMNAEIMRRALEYTRMLGIPIFEHCQDVNLRGDGVMHEGPISLRLGLKGIPRVAESTMVARDIALAASTGGHVHLSHISTRESVEVIRAAKSSGISVTAEVTPHHLTMTDEDVLEYNTLAKVMPPLCAEEDRLSLIDALEDGTIDCIATDHAPHASANKNRVFDAAPFGIIGLETAFPLLYTRFVETGIWSLDFLIERLTVIPARVMGKKWGTLMPGASADLTVFALGTEYTLLEKHLRSKSSNCPWLGQKLSARILATYVSGVPVFQNSEAFPKGVYAPHEVSVPDAKVKVKKAKPEKNTAAKPVNSTNGRKATPSKPKRKRSTAKS